MTRLTAFLGTDLYKKHLDVILIADALNKDPIISNYLSDHLPVHLLC